MDSVWIAKIPASPFDEAPGTQTGALRGQTFAVKDNIDVAGVPTTAACPAFAYQPHQSATVVQRLQNAGARVAGKTNLDQFACGLNGTRSPYGTPSNSFDAALVPGGSSSGSAVAVARGEVDFALGTDTAGSGRVPAAMNNLVGLKPTRGLLSNQGVVPACRSLDCISIFHTTVAGAVDVLMQAAAHDPNDPYSRPVRLDPAFFPAAFTFAVPRPEDREFYGDELSREAFAQACQRLEKLGGRAVEFDYRPYAAAASMLYEDAFVAERYAGIRDFFDAQAPSHPEAFDPTVRTIIESGRRFSAADWCQASDHLGLLRQGCDATLASVDVMVLPTTPTLISQQAMRADPIELNRRLGLYTNFVNLLDYAALAVPACLRPDGLPFGITFIGPAGSDLRLADIGQRFHHDTGLGAGATGAPLPPPRDIPRPAGTTVRLAVVGAHLTGMPLNTQLIERGARLLQAAFTAPDYRLFALQGTVPPKPGLLRVAPGQGHPIALEIWEMPLAHYGSFVALIGAPLGIGSLRLADGSMVQGFVCEALDTIGNPDISAYGGWRAYLAARSAPRQPIA
ncbi:MAG: allophanate hydrolase [Burkholderiaceae bacterium]|nr:allophanate hydrolase [Burkholderiaceae bacterium]